MKIYAISDLHINHPENRKALMTLSEHPDDWLIVAGDIAERFGDVEFALTHLTRLFRQVIWVPGNHELWTLPNSDEPARGVDRYERLIGICGKLGVLTPEDPFPIVHVGEAAARIVPMFLLYDYSFRPANVPLDRVFEWASAANSGCSDEYLLHPDPYPSRIEWCHARCDATLARLEAAEDDAPPTILVNHFPLIEEFAYAPFVPRFGPWCGTRRTRDWHTRFNTQVVVSGHLHIPITRYRDGVRFEEVSLGYPRQRHLNRHIDRSLRQIWPTPLGTRPRP